jgi:hypothetical protein
VLGALVDGQGERDGRSPGLSLRSARRRVVERGVDAGGNQDVRGTQANDAVKHAAANATFIESGMVPQI